VVTPAVTAAASITDRAGGRTAEADSHLIHIALPGRFSASGWAWTLRRQREMNRYADENR
jgi:hypothetical protein